MSKNDAILTLSEDDLRAYLVRNPDGFLKTLNKMKEKQKPFVMSWSWPAFFVTFIWMAYRRLWWILALVLGSLIALSVLEEVLEFSAGNGIGTIISVIFAMQGKLIVIQNATKAVAEADKQGLAGEERIAFLAEKGGVSVLGAWIASILFVSFFGLVIFAIFFT